MQRKPPCVGESWVNIPPLRGDELHRMTVLPYLMDYHYEAADRSSEPRYYTEHDLNRKSSIILLLRR